MGVSVLTISREGLVFGRNHIFAQIFEGKFKDVYRL